MRRLPLALMLLLPLTPRPGMAQGTPPHAWLFGAWTGGLFPVPSGESAQACKGQPVVVFSRDVVLRSSLTDATYVRRVIATALTSGNTTEFHFAPAPAPDAAADSAPSVDLGVAATPKAVGFGCADDPDLLRVQRLGNDRISFPGCTDFPNPLVRCPGR